MPKTFTDAYTADTTAADSLTGSEIIGYDPPAPASQSKGSTLTQLRSWLANFFSQTGHQHGKTDITDSDWMDKPPTAVEGNLAEFNASRNVIDSGVPTANVILNTTYNSRIGKSAAASIPDGVSETTIVGIPDTANELIVSFRDLRSYNSADIYLLLGYADGGSYTYITLPALYAGGYANTGDSTVKLWSDMGGIGIVKGAQTGTAYTMNLTITRSAFTTDTFWHARGQRTWQTGSAHMPHTTDGIIWDTVNSPSYINALKLCTTLPMQFVNGGYWQVRWRQ